MVCYDAMTLNKVVKPKRKRRLCCNSICVRTYDIEEYKGKTSKN